MTLDSKVPGGPLAQKWDSHKFASKLVNPANRRKHTVIIVGTGLAGAFVAAHATIVEYLLQAARNFIFSTASPPAVEHALLTSFALIEGPLGAGRRANLVARQTQLRDGLIALIDRHPRLGWSLTDAVTPIQPLIVGGNAEVMALAAVDLLQSPAVIDAARKDFEKRRGARDVRDKYAPDARPWLEKTP